MASPALKVVVSIMVCWSMVPEVDGSPVPNASGLRKRCTSDDECPLSHFCNGQNCTSCLHCGNFHRHRKDGFHCAKKQSDCGDCKNGYKEVLSSLTSFKSCDLISENKAPINNSEGADSIYVISLSLAPLIVLIVIFVILAACSLSFMMMIWKRIKLSQNQKSTCELDAYKAMRSLVSSPVSEDPPQTISFNLSSSFSRFSGRS